MPVNLIEHCRQGLALEGFSRIVPANERVRNTTTMGAMYSVDCCSGKDFSRSEKNGVPMPEERGRGQPVPRVQDDDLPAELGGKVILSALVDARFVFHPYISSHHTPVSLRHLQLETSTTD